MLIASDVFFLWKIFKSIGSRKKSIPDERYFELKYNINLLKAVSATLIFLLGFLGFTTYQDITKIVESDFEEKFTVQQIRIDKLDSIVKEYEETVKLLKSEEGKSIENLNDVKREFNKINTKVAQAQNALKYTPQFYVVRDLVYDEDIDNKTETKKYEGIRYYFGKMKTIYGEKIPIFKTPPLLNVQGNRSDFLITNVTKDYFDLIITYSSGIGGENDRKYPFNIWIVPLGQ